MPYLNLIFNPISLVLYALLAIMFALYLRELENRKLAEKENQLIFNQLQQKASTVLEQTLAKAKGILENAALEEIKIVDTSREQIQKVEEVYSNFLEDLKKRAEVQEKQSQESIKQETMKGLDRIEQNLADFLNLTQQQSIGSIQLEIQAARQLVETYKRRQLALIDENIIAILEKSMGVVLSKRLSLKEHMDLVYESLEKAKAEKFIV